MITGRSSSCSRADGGVCSEDRQEKRTHASKNNIPLIGGLEKPFSDTNLCLKTAASPSKGLVEGDDTNLHTLGVPEPRHPME